MGSIDNRVIIFFCFEVVKCLFDSIILNLARIDQFFFSIRFSIFINLYFLALNIKMCLNK